MSKGYLRNISWDFFSRLIIISFLFLQIVRWAILPQFLDMYYHLLTAQGFLRVGGYNGWDFLQYAPVGRAHIYPPFFHILLASFLRLGITPVILAKLCEAATPVLFLFSLFYFIRKNFGSQLAFFTLLALASSFSFYLSLINNVPATLALIFGFFAWDFFFNGQILRPALLLGLSFYTHISIPWFLVLSILIYSLFDKESRKAAWIISLLAVLIALPVLWKQFSALKLISAAIIKERYFSEFKIFNYILAAAGALFTLKKLPKFRMFISLLLASLIFLPYPYRFFSAQGSFPVILLSAVSLSHIFTWISKRGIRLLFFCGVCFYCLLFSPTVLMEPAKTSGVKYKLYTWDSSLVDMIFPEHNKRIASVSLWFPDQYLQAIKIIKDNSGAGGIIHSNLGLSVFLAALSDRATTEGLFSEIVPHKNYDPVASSQITIITNDMAAAERTKILQRYSLLKIGENKLFTIYKNTSCTMGVKVRRLDFVPFGLIAAILLLFSVIFLKSEIIEAWFRSRGWFLVH